MTLSQFENGYWYATQLKDFADAIGIPSANKLRKDELERAIRSFLVTSKAKTPTKRNLSTSGSVRLCCWKNDTPNTRRTQLINGQAGSRGSV